MSKWTQTTALALQILVSNKC